ncbi:hypothetical protein IJJ12_00160 [bacterium]|nr:hypothetical protein [bacterium]
MSKKWYHYVAENLRPWALETMQLLRMCKESEQKLANYDFVVYPIARIYEPFLKDVFYAHHLIEQTTYRSKKFSLGRSLNPDVRLEQRNELWLYDDVVRLAGERVTRELWDTWLERNHLMHLYPGEIQTLTLKQAEAKIDLFIRAIELAGSMSEQTAEQKACP